MGFSSSLQGATSHDAILQRVDAELRLLENMKRCLGARVKADREYAIALNSFVLQSQKFDAHGDVQCGSLVAKSWSVFIEETDKMSKACKDGADTLATTSLEKLNNLYLVGDFLKPVL
jgi:tyrosine-protein kinase Fer